MPASKIRVTAKAAVAQRQSGAAQGDQLAPDANAPEPTGKIAFASDRDGNFEIYVMNPDGSGLFRVTDNPAEDTQPSWSPDGTRLAFVSNRDGNKEIYVVGATGGAATRLTNNAAEDFDPPGPRTAGASPSSHTATATTKSM